MVYRNAAHGFIGELDALVERGQDVNVRGADTKELLSRRIQFERPLERCITLPGRQNDIFATVAETMWVLGGRDDLAYLSEYLPRAIDFSDDGHTWRAAYGPRLRSWHGTDQLAEASAILRSDPMSRRVVLSIFDPALDYVNSKDIPCNNWIQFLARDNRLNMNVVIRSNDLIWGFSGINTFEWSVLHDLMAHSTGLGVGSATYFVGSLHLYQRHFDRGQKILSLFEGETGYEAGWEPIRCQTAVQDLDFLMRDWFTLESKVRDRTIDEADLLAFPDPLFRAFIWMLFIRTRYQDGAARVELENLLAQLGRVDLALATGTKIFGREWLVNQLARSK